MSFDFSLPPRVEEWRGRITKFTDEAAVLPEEAGRSGRSYADVRAFRIYGGASGVHRMSIATRAARRARANG